MNDKQVRIKFPEGLFDMDERIDLAAVLKKEAGVELVDWVVLPQNAEIVVENIGSALNAEVVRGIVNLQTEDGPACSGD